MFHFVSKLEEPSNFVNWHVLFAVRIVDCMLMFRVSSVDSMWCWCWSLCRMRFRIVVMHLIVVAPGGSPPRLPSGF